MTVMGWNRLNRMVTAAATIGALATSATSFAQVPEARIRELIKEAAERAAVSQQPAQPGQPAQAPGATRPTVRLTLDDAVKFALDRNLDIAVQRLNPEISDIAIAAVKAAYRPALTSTLATQSQTNPSTSVISGAGAGQGVTNGLTTFTGG